MVQAWSQAGSQHNTLPGPGLSTAGLVAAPYLHPPPDLPAIVSLWPSLRLPGPALLLLDCPCLDQGLVTTKEGISWEHCDIKVEPAAWPLA
jgi:hypothetical protein